MDDHQEEKMKCFDNWDPKVVLQYNINSKFVGYY